jgi:hypothetical protein
MDLADFSITCFNQNGLKLYPDTIGTCELITNVINISDKSLVTIFPNPFSDKITFEIQNIGEFEIILYDITSRKLLQQKFTNSVTINTEKLINGVYIYELRNIKEVIMKGKVLNLDLPD